MFSQSKGKTNVLVTGATGFIGSSLSDTLIDYGYGVEKVARRARPGIIAVPLTTDDWSLALKDIDVVVHCAALAHVPESQDESFRALVRELNVEASARLAKQASDHGIKRFIYLSSVKAMGESTRENLPYINRSEQFPQDFYGESKRDAELALKRELTGSEMELVIIRPPLVYGPGVKGNFKALMGLAKKNLPLPFGSVANKRSLVSLDNLVSLIVTCVKHPEPLNDTFLVSDDHDVSTKELFETLTRAYGKDPKIWPFPVSLMKLGAKMLGKKAIADRLFGNLQLDISHTKKTLSWKPPVSFKKAIQNCVNSENQ